MLYINKNKLKILLVVFLMTRYILIDNRRIKLLFLHESGITEESKARRCMDSMKWAALLTTLNISFYLKLTLNVSKVWLQAQQ